MNILVIGLDGATFDQLQPWIEAGHMPTLERLVRHGVSGRLHSTTPPITAPAWSTFITGLNPGRHGVFSFLRPVEGTSRERALNDLRSIQGVRFWSVLNSGGLRAGVVDLPMAYPPEVVEGFMVSDVIASGWKRVQAYPESLKVVVEQRLPDVVPMLGRALLDGVAPTEAYLDRMLASLECKESLDLFLLNDQDSDVFVTVYPQLDVFQHHFWFVVDETHPWHNTETAARLAHKAEQFIRRLDMTISRLLKSLGDGTVILLSDHGFGPVKRVIYVNTLLRSLGYIHIKSKHRRTGKLTPKVVKGGLAKLDVFGLRGLIGKRLRQRVRKTLRRALAPDIDWAGTQAYFEMTNDQGVWINRRTKLNPSGLEMSGVQYEELRAQIVDDLRRAVDPETGQPLFEQVHSREEVFTGPYVEFAPDVMFQPCYGYMTSSDFFSKITGDQPRGLVSGYHRPDGIFIASGPNIQSGKLVGANIADVAPTILYLAGSSVPSKLDGRVLDVAASEYQKTHPVSYFDASSMLGGSQQTDDEGYSAQDEKEMIERLRSLGYM